MILINILVYKTQSQYDLKIKYGLKINDIGIVAYKVVDFIKYKTFNCVLKVLKSTVEQNFKITNKYQL